MKKNVKKLFLSFLCVCLFVLLTACADKATLTDTVLSIDGAFAGERTMTFSVEEDSDLVLDKLTEIFEENLPECLEMNEPVVKDGTAQYTFVLGFDSLEDYTAKIASLLERTPSITYIEPSQDLFTSGITLKEDFTSGDLFGWAVSIAKEEGYSVRIVTRGTRTSVVMGDSIFVTGEKISVASEFTPLEKVVVITERYSADEYKRTFEVIVSADSLQKIGKSKLVSELLAPMTDDVDADMLSATPAFVYDEQSDTYSYLIISSVLSGERLGELTALVLDGSVTVYDDGAQDMSSAFSVSGTLSEKLCFDGLVCNTNGSANIELRYAAKDSTRFDNGESEITYDVKSVTEYELDVTCRTIYELSAIVVESGVSAAGNMHVYITCSYADKLSSKAAAQLAVDVLGPEYVGLDVYVDSQNSGFGTSATDTGAYCLRIDAKGEPADITAALQSAFGDGNVLTVEKIENFRPFITYNVEHKVDISSLCDAALYEGGVEYKFTGATARAKNVCLKVDDAIFSYDILEGEKQRGGFNKSAIESGAFTFEFQYEQLNLVFWAAVLLGGALVLGVLGLISRTIIRASRRRKKAKKTDTTYEAVREVALALVPVEERTELAQLPDELVNRQTVMLEPRYDDGLDEDEDEPEGVWLFSTMLKLFAVIAGVLFFLSFFTVTKTNFIGGNPEGITGFNLVFGKELFGVEFASYPLAALLLVGPVLILALLSFRAQMPRLVSPICVFGISVFEIFFLLGLPNAIDERMEVIKAAVAEYISSPAYQSGYNNSLVVYILLAVGAALLVAAELVGLVVTKARSDED